MSISVQHKNLPEISELKKRLDALVKFYIITGNADNFWERRYIKVSGANDPVSVYHYDDGCGNNMTIIFSDNGCIIRGHDHESYFNSRTIIDGVVRDDIEYAIWPGIYDKVPENLLSLLDRCIDCYELEEGVDEKSLVTFCIWRETTDSEWRKGDIMPLDENAPDYNEYHAKDPDGFDDLIKKLFASAKDFHEWVEDDYCEEFPVEGIKSLYDGKKVDETIIKAINPERNVQEALDEVENL